ncbi:hypothetical protein [Mesorhizobium captivum]|uniref:hypothetical protein n=1 Tax=Mesorhizobium captivum TaxID=3072319 RepID=UPI002A23F23B|nr:hypothetical protein [Mesorhizobium sp. VK22E]MDX8507216.1 hypothetical protein [Mesorhizobium sp. VK22E]
MLIVDYSPGDRPLLIEAEFVQGVHGPVGRRVRTAVTEDVILGETKRPSSSLSKQLQPLGAPATAERLAA